MMAVKSQPWALQFRIMVANPQQRRSRTHKTPILAQYASLDTRVNDGWPAYETITQEEKSSACRLFYEGGPWFSHNNTTRATMKSSYLSWTRTIDFRKRTEEEVNFNACYKSEHWVPLFLCHNCK
jgi:carboxymethylenebutenolidase